MGSSIFNQMGLGNLDLGIVIIVLAGITLISLILMIIFIVKEEKLKKRYNKFMMGKDAQSLEKDIITLFEKNNEFCQMAEANRKDIKTLYKKVAKAYSKVGIVKYDAYQQMGGLLSFSLAMLNEKDDGFVLNSIHSAEGCYTYTKEIKNGESKVELGNEEKFALEQAME